jgi:hypothetical protein
MQQISSTDRLLMAAYAMTDSLKLPHPDVPFATFGDATITALAQLETLFKNKFPNPVAPEISQASNKSAENKQPAALIHQRSIITKPDHKTKSAQQLQPTSLSLKTCHNFRECSQQLFGIIQSQSQSKSTIFQKKFQKPLAPEISQAPIKAAENKQPTALTQHVLTSPVKHNYQTRSHNQISPAAPTNVIASQNSPQLPSLVTPTVPRSASPPMVPIRARNLHPRNLSQDDFLNMGSVNQAITLGINHWTNISMANAVIHPTTGKEMQYMDLMKDPTLEPLRKRGFGN